MHRSGTSMLAHLLGALQFSFGGKLIQPDAGNPLGYWEHAGVVTAHNSFLALRGRAWHDVHRYSPEDFDSPEGKATRRQLREIFNHDFAPHQNWVVKDPRICRLLPLWSEVAADPRADLRFLHIVRQPLAVAASLATRNGFSTARSLLLWLRHILEAEAATRGRPRAWLRWEELTSDPPSTLARAFGAVCLSESFPQEALAAAAAEVLETGAIHHRIPGAVELESSFHWVQRTDEAVGLLVEGENEEAQRLLDEIDEAMVASERQLLFASAVRATPGDGDLEDSAQLKRLDLLESQEESRRKRQVQLLEQLDGAIGGMGRRMRESSNREVELVSRLSSLEESLHSHLQESQGELGETVGLLHRSLALSNSTDRRLLGKSLHFLEETEKRHSKEISQLRATHEAQREEHSRRLEELRQLQTESERRLRELSHLRDEHETLREDHTRSLEELSRLRDEYEALREVHDRNLEELSRLQAAHVKVEETRQQLAAQCHQLSTMLDSIHASRSWRITRPLRALLAPLKR
jgi:hypothetical protein